MSRRELLPYEVRSYVRDTCVCLYLQRATRVVARHFDEALQPVNLTNQQFSLLMALNLPEPPIMALVAQWLAMDRTTLTANLKPLERRGLVKIAVDPEDKRSRRLAITPAGRALLSKAFPIWRRAHEEIDRLVDGANLDRLRTDLRAISTAGTPAMTRDKAQAGA